MRSYPTDLGLFVKLLMVFTSTFMGITSGTMGITSGTMGITSGTMGFTSLVMLLKYRGTSMDKAGMANISRGRGFHE